MSTYKEIQEKINSMLREERTEGYLGNWVVGSDEIQKFDDWEKLGSTLMQKRIGHVLFSIDVDVE